MNQTEEEIQHAIIMWLEWSGYLVYQFAPARSHKRLGGIVPSGYPDFQVLTNSKILFFETKTNSGKVSPKQQRVHSDMAKEGFMVHVVRCLEDVKAVLRDAGI